ncbi:hypothetical protein [Microbacterium kunmingense]|uniref:hypothetical protein n=1 Tax=Microbacterium kunmingense TaxID=2915939 RepID=UPI0020039F07|nr:hypothetical protein [Microbacterium kunmingense]
MVSDLEIGDAFTHRIDDPSALVPEHPREWERKITVPSDRVGVTYAGRDEPHPNLSRARLFELELLEPYVAADMVSDSSCDSHL